MQTEVNRQRSKVGQRVAKAVVTLPAVLFVVMGLRWLVAPADIAAELGFPLAHGVGRSSQIGDFAAFFLTAGICLLLGVASGKRVWLYPAALLLGLAAAGRILAWAVHDAAFAGEMIVFEFGVSILLFIVSRWLEPATPGKEPQS
ncbi:MAG: hypothetical protein AAF515_10330 [Pseudomonadota bacterium]